MTTSMQAARQKASPLIGIVGCAGGYGRWLTQFLTEKMKLPVIGHDPRDPMSASPKQVGQQADILIFAVPMRTVQKTIREYVALMDGQDHNQLWLDLSSVKETAIQEMLVSSADVVGLHPMTAPPTRLSLEGYTLFCCQARLVHWRDWLEQFYTALGARVIHIDVGKHDRLMALMQAMVHATMLAQAGAIHHLLPPASEDCLASGTMLTRMNLALMARIYSLNSSLYEDIQFTNRYVPKTLDTLIEQLQSIRSCLDKNDVVGRDQFRRGIWDANKGLFKPKQLEKNHETFLCFERLLLDLAETHAMYVDVQRQQGSQLLSDILAIMARMSINLASIHSLPGTAETMRFHVSVSGALSTAQIGQINQAIKAHQLAARLLPIGSS